MTTIRRTFTVAPAPSAVLDYLKDFSHAEEWDPGTVSCHRLDEGPIAVGSRFHNESKIAGVSTELVYTLEELTAERVVFAGSNDTATTKDIISVAPAADGGSEITYVAEIEMTGLAKLATPAVKVLFEKIGNDTVKQMTGVLNALDG